VARPLRIQYPGAFYHVMNRGTNHGPIFWDPEGDRHLFKNVLSQAVRLWKIRIHAYSLMENHYHLLIETPLANLSRGMRHINGVYTQLFNKIHGRDGPLMRGRFKSILVQKEVYFKELLRYIHLNGVRALKFPSPNEDPYCSHRAYTLIRNRPSWLTTTVGLSYFGSDKGSAISLFDAFVNEGISGNLVKILNRERWPAILGAKEFIDEIRNKFKIARPPHSEKPQENDLKDIIQFSREEVLSSIQRVYAVRLKDILARNGTRANEPRQAAMYFLRMVSHLSYTEIGNLLGGLSDTSIWYGIGKIRKKRSKKFKLLESSF